MMQDSKGYPVWDRTSAIEAQLDKALLSRLVDPPTTILKHLLADREIRLHHCYANAVSVRRLGYNDEGADGRGRGCYGCGGNSKVRTGS